MDGGYDNLAELISAGLLPVEGVIQIVEDEDNEADDGQVRSPDRSPATSPIGSPRPRRPATDKPKPSYQNFVAPGSGLAEQLQAEQAHAQEPGSRPNAQHGAPAHQTVLLTRPTGAGFGLGLGITNTMVSQSELCVAMIQPNTPAAAEPKLSVGARLVSVNGVNVQSMTVEAAANILKGTKSATIVFTVPNEFSAKASFIKRSASVQPQRRVSKEAGADASIGKGLSQHGTGPGASQPAPGHSPLRVPSSRWYIGNVPAKDANLLLEGTPAGSFVVRESAAQPGNYTLAYR